IFATARALSQVATTPDAVRTPRARPRTHRRAVARRLHAYAQALRIEDINLEELIATALAEHGQGNRWRPAAPLRAGCSSFPLAARRFLKPAEEGETRALCTRLSSPPQGVDRPVLGRTEPRYDLGEPSRRRK